MLVSANSRGDRDHEMSFVEYGAQFGQRGSHVLRLDGQENHFGGFGHLAIRGHQVGARHLQHKTLPSGVDRVARPHSLSRHQAGGDEPAAEHRAIWPAPINPICLSTLGSAQVVRSFTLCMLRQTVMSDNELHRLGEVAVEKSQKLPNEETMKVWRSADSTDLRQRTVAPSPTGMRNALVHQTLRQEMRLEIAMATNHVAY